MDITIFDGKYAFLSNFHEVSVYYDGRVYGSSEAAYQAQKAVKFDDAWEFTKYAPLKAKRMGRKIEIRLDWAAVRVAFMRDILFAKFFQNPALAERLLATGNCKLVEGNYWHDTFWGVDSETGEGQNNLGKLLMEIREELKHPEVFLSNTKDTWLTRFTVPEKTTFRRTLPGHANIELHFEQRYEFKHKNWNSGINDLTYRFHGREFTDLSFRNGMVLAESPGSSDIVQQIKSYADGKTFFYQSNDIPVFDSGDAEWDSISEFVIFRDEAGVKLICSQHGWKIPSISIYIGLKNSEPLLDEILARLN